MTSNDDLLEAIRKMGIKVEESAKDIKKEVNKKIENLERKVDSAKYEANEKEAKNSILMNKMNKRLLDLEEKFRIEALEKKQKENTVQKERVKEFEEAVGLNIVRPESLVRIKTWTELIEENKEKERARREKAKDEEQKKWKKQIEIRKRVEQIEKVGEKSVEEEKKKSHDEIVKKKSNDKDLKLDTSDNSPNEDDWSWDESDKDWDGTEERRNDERRKKILRYRRRKMLRTKTATRAKHMIGLGPILKQSVNYFHDITSDIEEAKKMAINEFMITYLQFTEEEVQETNIVDTATSKSDDEIIYVTFSDHDTIRDIYGRAAEIRNNSIQTRVFVPPQFWPRYQHISHYCAKLREDNKDLKTIIRFGNDDVEVMIRDRSKDEQFKVLSLDEIEESGTIPKFKHEVIWRKRSERPLKKNLRTVSGTIVPPSLQRSPISRSSSSGSVLHPSKRQKKDQDSSKIIFDSEMDEVL